MPMQSLYLLILVFIILLIIYPFPMGIKMTYSPFQNFGVLVFKIFNKRIKIATFSIEGLGIRLTTKKGVKYQDIQLKVNKREIVYVKNLIKQIKDKVKVKEMSFISRIGVGDAFKTAMVIGGISELFYGIFGYFKNEKQTSSIRVICNPEWQKKVFFSAINLKFSVSIFDMIYCLIYANLKARKVK